MRAFKRAVEFLDWVDDLTFYLRTADALLYENDLRFPMRTSNVLFASGLCVLFSERLMRSILRTIFASLQERLLRSI